MRRQLRRPPAEVREMIRDGRARYYALLRDGVPAAEAAAMVNGDGPTLRDDGPTVAEYVKAGYKAANYPPRGYRSRSTPEEIDAAIAEAGGSNPNDAIEIPAAWAEMPWPDRRKLAAQLAQGRPIATGDEVAAVITDELKRRAEAAAKP